MCALALPRRPPPPPGVVWRAHLARYRHLALVGPFYVVRAPPPVLPRSLAPSGVLGGGRSGPGSPLPSLGLWAPRGAGLGGVACHRCERRLVSDAVPPPAARPLAGVAGVQRPVCPRCCRCERGDPAAAPQRAPLRAGAARCGGGGRASPGGCPPLLRGASDVRRSPSPDCPPTGRAVRVHYPRAVGAGVWVWGPYAVPLACMLFGGCVQRGWRGAVSGGGGLPAL